MAHEHQNVVTFYGGRRIINASELYHSLMEDMDSEVDVSFEKLYFFWTVLTNNTYFFFHFVRILKRIFLLENTDKKISPVLVIGHHEDNAQVEVQTEQEGLETSALTEAATCRCQSEQVFTFIISLMKMHFSGLVYCF